ncbi:MAG: hypothetical protein IPJ65_25380 [Archangiaceae bacterium]|nr:hypothetical protein [Archangiaceae bacterium]
MTVVVGFAMVALAVACGGGISQSTECKDYVACYKHTVGGTTQDSVYGDMGTCWTTGVQATADSCTAACKTALESLKTSYSDAGC